MVARASGRKKYADVAVLADGLRAPLIRISHVLRRQAAQLPLTMPQSAVLGQLIDGRKKRVTDLAAEEGVKPSTMTDLLSRMELREWITISTPVGDRRVSEVSVTDQGRAVLQDAIERRNRLLAEYLTTLDPASRELLAAAVPALRELARVESTTLDALGQIQGDQRDELALVHRLGGHPVPVPRQVR